MSLPVLEQLYGEVRRLATAGSNLAPGDFRLQRLLPAIETLAQKAPVFAKVSAAATKLLESDEKSSAPALHELSTLVHALRATQCDTLPPTIKPTETMVPLEVLEAPRTPGQLSSRMLVPILAALTTTGGGRIEVIKDALERNLLGDIRLRLALARAVGDPYPEIADLIADKVLPTIGPSMITLVRNSFNFEGNMVDARRLKVLHRLDPTAARDLVMKSLDDGSPPVKLAAIECLGGSREDRERLTLLCKSRNKETRAAALAALVDLGGDVADAELMRVVKSDDVIVSARTIQLSQSPLLAPLLADETQAAFEKLIAASDPKEVEKIAPRAFALLESLAAHPSEQGDAVILAIFASRNKFKSVRAPIPQEPPLYIARMMRQGSEKLQRALLELHPELQGDMLEEAFLAGFQLLTPAELFHQFSHYLTVVLDEKKRPAKGESKANYRASKISSGIKLQFRQGHNHHSTCEEWFTTVRRFDPRWIEEAMKSENTELVLYLALPGNSAAMEYLSRKIDEIHAIAKNWWDYRQLAQSIVYTEHPRATELMLKLLEFMKAAHQSYGSYGFSDCVRLIPLLPPESAPQFEAIAKELPDKWLGELIPAIDALKGRATKA